MSSCSTACTYQEHSNFANTSQHYVIIENFRSDNEPSENFRMEQEAACGQSVTCVERNRVTLIARLSVLMAVATQLSKVSMNVV